MTPVGLVAMIVDAVFKSTALLLVAFMVARALLNAPAAARLVFLTPSPDAIGMQSGKRTLMKVAPKAPRWACLLRFVQWAVQDSNL